jgi:hypothetical protein
MRLYDKYHLTGEIDFLNVVLDTDNRVWIDPMMMHMDKSEMGQTCCAIVRDYFATLLDYAILGDNTNGLAYAEHFTEFNETRLGYSADCPRGVSGGATLGREIFYLIRGSKATKTELIGDIFDGCVMIEKLGVDKMSDFITSLILEELISYTQEQCELHGIPMIETKLKSKYWSHTENKWVNSGKILLPYDEELQLAIVFVPIKFVEDGLVYSYDRFYNKGMIPYLGRQAVANRIDGLIRILKDKTIKPLYKAIRERNACTRANVNAFIVEHPEVYDEYKRKQLAYVNYETYKNKKK